MGNMQGNVEFRIMPSGKGGWYWEVIAQSRALSAAGWQTPRVQHPKKQPRPLVKPS